MPSKTFKRCLYLFLLFNFGCGLLLSMHAWHGLFSMFMADIAAGACLTIALLGVIFLGLMHAPAKRKSSD